MKRSSEQNFIRRKLPWAFTLLLLVGFYFAKGRQAQRLSDGASPALSAFSKSLQHLRIEPSELSEDALMRHAIEDALNKNGLILSTEKPFTAFDSQERLLLSADFDPCDNNFQSGDIVGVGLQCPKTENWIVVTAVKNTKDSTGEEWQNRVEKAFFLDGTELKNSYLPQKFEDLNQCVCLRHKDFYIGNKFSKKHKTIF